MPDINENFHQPRRDKLNPRSTTDVSLIRVSNDTSGRAVATDASVGYHPVKRPMYIKVLKGAGENATLQCHYDPKDFTELYSVSYEDVPATGAFVSPIVFKFSQPRKWSMKLLFNDLGVNQGSRYGAAKSVDESLDALHSYTLPQSVGGYGRPGTSAEADGKKPPVLLVFLIKRAFKCHITAMTVKRIKIDSGTSATLRAEVDVEFTEFIESPIKKG